ncbi:hypothetical protein CAPTEDRAFT_192811 [Capitella teleta]|uniref:Uncharacterized protein n=1 Tax=Capitella teleta TaxID=283909 RepID=R7TEP9_CAPTE|nr:hypothetical protein CAPTEDRAFT_192811 [Capitella teleta]|eukprot:ELT92204.1 hypothetical protein CAPTEDRAFT_192811 [Capitella teleta]
MLVYLTDATEVEVRSLGGSINVLIHGELLVEHNAEGTCGMQRIKIREGTEAGDIVCFNQWVILSFSQGAASSAFLRGSHHHTILYAHLLSGKLSLEVRENQGVVKSAVFLAIRDSPKGSPGEERAFTGLKYQLQLESNHGMIRDAVMFVHMELSLAFVQAEVDWSVIITEYRLVSRNIDWSAGISIGQPAKLAH